MIGGRGGSATTAQVLVFHEIWDLGCIACRIVDIDLWTAPEQDHRNTGDLAGMPRVDNPHGNTLGLCQWHHRGIPIYGLTASECERRFGPSKHLAKKSFIARFGSIGDLHDLQRRALSHGIAQIIDWAGER